MRSQKIRLKFTKNQNQLAWWYSKISRNYWNLLVDIDNRNNLGEFDKLLTEKGNKLYYSKTFDRNIFKLSDSDYLHLAKNIAMQDEEKYNWYFKPNQSFIYTSIARNLLKVKYKNKGKLKFKSVFDSKVSFNVRCDIFPNKKRPSRIYLKDSGRLQIPTLGDVKLGKYRKDMDISGKKQIATISYDGKYWYLSYSEKVTNKPKLYKYTDGVGMDLGIENLATLSTGKIIPNIKTFRRYRILNKRLKRLQRKLSYKYLVNNCDKHNKTNNIKKLEHKIKLIYRSIKNLRVNHIREFISKIIKEQPQYISIEDLNVKGMMKNRHLAKDITNCSFYTIREHLIRKAKERNIEIRLVDRFYPSSKKCSNCGNYKGNLKLSDRIYKCDDCNVQIDRDINASLNLKNTTNYIVI